MWRLYNVDTTSMQRYDVASTLRRRCINVMWLLGRTATEGMQRLYNVASTSMRRPDVASTLMWRCIDVNVTLYKRDMPTGLERPVETEIDKFRLFARRLHNPLNFSVGYNDMS